MSKKTHFDPQKTSDIPSETSTYTICSKSHEKNNDESTGQLVVNGSDICGADPVLSLRPFGMCMTLFWFLAVWKLTRSRNRDQVARFKASLKHEMELIIKSFYGKSGWNTTMTYVNCGDSNKFDL